MKNYALILLLLISTTSFAQNYVPFASGRITDTAKTTGSMLIPYVVRLPYYAVSDTDKVFGVTSNGTLVLRTKGTGGGADSAIYPTQYQLDTAKKKLRSQLADSLDAMDLNRAASNGATISRNVTFDNAAGSIVTNASSVELYGYTAAAEDRWGLSSTGSGVGTYGILNLYYNDGTNRRMQFIPSAMSGNSTTTLRATSGTMAYTSDTANCVQDADSNVARGWLSYSYWLNNSWAKNGNSFGAFSKMGSIDAQPIGFVVNNLLFDSIASNRTRYITGDSSTTNQYIMRWINANATVTQTSYGWLGVSKSGSTVLSQNKAFIGFGTSSAATQFLTGDGFAGYTNLQIYGSTNANPSNIIGANVSTNNSSILISHGKHIVGGGITGTGTINLLGLGNTNGNDSVKVSSTTNYVVLADKTAINQPAGSTGYVATLSNADIGILSAPGYRFLNSTNSVGYQAYLAGTAPSYFNGSIIYTAPISTTYADSGVVIKNGIIKAIRGNQGSLTATGNTTLSIPADSWVVAISFTPVSTETIEVGTTPGGDDVVTSQSFTAGVEKSVTVNMHFTSATTLYIQGAAGSVNYFFKY